LVLGSYKGRYGCKGKEGYRQEMTTGKLYRIPGTDSRIYAVEEGSEVMWTKFNEDYAEIKNMRNKTGI
jgi:hypothetical protein